MESLTFTEEEMLEEINENDSSFTTKSSKASSNAICDQCGKDFSNVYTLGAHKKQIHEGIKAHACGICGTRFATKFKLKRHHLGVHSDKRDFHCGTCNNSFKTRDMLIKHQRTHFVGLGPFNCNLCEDEVFKFKSGLDHHMLLKHAEKSPIAKEKPIIFYKCSLCEKMYKTLKTLERHEQSHHNEDNEDEPVNCVCSEPNCLRVFRNLKDLTKHVKAEHKSMTCRYCLKTYKTASNFEAHLASHEKENSMKDYEYVIDETQSDEYFEDEYGQDEIIEEAADQGIPEDLMKNIDESMVMIERIETERFVHEVEVIEELIPEQFDVEDKSAETLNDPDESENFLIEQDDGIDFYDTIIAEELEPSELEVISHEPSNFEEYEDNILNDTSELIIVETVPKPLKKNLISNERSVCDECGAKFKNNSHLQRHVQRKHRKDSHKLECHICGSKFLLNYDLRRHMIKHTSKRDFSCDICQQRFKTELSLKNHIKIVHSENRPSERNYKCKMCDRSYFHQRHLDYHFRTHTNDAKYSCKLCKPEKRFFYSDAVKWHEIRHHGEPAPFNCSICSKKFIHGRSLDSHMKEHVGGSGSLAVSCPICQKLVSEKRHMKRHMRSHTGKEFSCSCGDSFKERHQLTKHSKNCAQIKENTFQDDIDGS